MKQHKPVEQKPCQEKKNLGEQTLMGLLGGKVVISDQTVNKYLAPDATDATGQGLRVYAKADNVIEIYIATKWGQFRLFASVTKLIHNNEQSILALQLINKELLGNSILS